MKYITSSIALIIFASTSLAIELVTLTEKQVVPGTNLEWHKYKEDETIWHLFVKGEQKGALYPDNTYRSLVRGINSDAIWSGKMPCPYPLPINLEMKIIPRPVENFGVDQSQIHRERVTVNGVEVNGNRVFQQVGQGGGQLLDDAHYSFVTFICADEAKRKAVEQAWQTDPRLADARRVMHFNAVPLVTPKGPHHVARLYQLEKDERFAKAGGVFMVQGPAGADGKSVPTAIFGTDIELLTKWLPQARRDVDPNYQPNKVPDATKPRLIPGLDWSALVAWVRANPLVITLCIAIIYLFISNRK